MIGDLALKLSLLVSLFFMLASGRGPKYEVKVRNEFQVPIRIRLRNPVESQEPEYVQVGIAQTHHPWEFDTTSIQNPRFHRRVRIMCDVLLLYSGGEEVQDKESFAALDTGTPPVPLSFESDNGGVTVILWILRNDGRHVKDQEGNEKFVRVWEKLNKPLHGSSTHRHRGNSSVSRVLTLY